MPFPFARPLAAGLMAGAAALALAACTPPPPTGSPSSTQQSGSALPSVHVHGLSVSGDTGKVLLATHDGLFDVTRQPTKIGATNDLMGFTAGADAGTFYASGHPGPDSDLPNPLGLLKSSDGGETWEQLSRQGESDFHALTVTKSGIVAFDGKLQTSPDGKTWTATTADFVPAVLAGNDDTDIVLATTAQGLQRSTDGGATWRLEESAPVIQFAAFADPTEAAGVEPDGTVHYTSDAGATWTRKGKIDGQVLAIAAVKGEQGRPWIWAATPEGIIVSTDGGTEFRPSDAD